MIGRSYPFVKFWLCCLVSAIFCYVVPAPATSNRTQSLVFSEHLLNTLNSASSLVANTMQTCQQTSAGGLTYTETAQRLQTQQSTATSSSVYPSPAHTSPLGQNITAQSTGMQMLPSDQLTYNGLEVVSEQVVEHTIKVPRKTVREEIRERVVVIPEKVMVEDIVEDQQMVRERIVQVKKPVIREKIVEVEMEKVIENVIQVPEDRVEYRVRYVEDPRPREVIKPVKVIQERFRPVPVDRPIMQTKIITRTVEVPEVQIQEVTIPRPVDQYVTVEVPEFRTVENIVEIDRIVPVAVEQVTHVNYELDHIEAEYEEVPYPVFVPQFTEVPIPAHEVTDETVMQSQAIRQQIAAATSQQMPSLCVIEDLGNAARRFQPQMIIDPALYEGRINAKVAAYQSSRAA